MEKMFNTPYVPISWGELIDKITILEIKRSNIESQASIKNISIELLYLEKILQDNHGVSGKVADLRLQLSEVNARLWDIEDRIREKELRQEFDDEFIETARSVYLINDQRARLKRRVNLLLDSEIVEEKGYLDFN